jgi:O-methyltransferase
MGITSLQRLARNLLEGGARGLSLPIRRSKTQHLGHELVVPKATYSPWLKDAAFKSLYQELKSHTLVDEYRCYEIWYLLKQLDMPGDILEVGVWKGGTGLLMAAHEQQAGRETTIYLADTFEGVVKAGSRDSYYHGSEHADASQQEVEDKASHLGLKNISILKGVFPDETQVEVAGNQFKLCHIDVDVYDSAKSVFDWVWPRLNSGGLVIFDDFGFSCCDGITELVHELTGGSDRRVFHNLNGHAVIMKCTA